MIEAVIISVDLEHDTELGVNFALTDNLANLLGTVGTRKSAARTETPAQSTPTQLLAATGKIAQSATTDGQGFTSATNGVKFGFVANNVTGFVRALETIGSTKILASPRILVLNKPRADIQLGNRLGFQTLSQNFTSTIQQVQFLNTGTLLRLRPFVSDDGMVRMEIHPERSSGSVVNNIPNQTTAELTTNVMVPDGATLVIGGLMEDEDDFQMQGLPGLSRLPVLGFLFGARQKTEGRRELVVLLTPHIWSPDVAMAHAPAPGIARGAQIGETANASASTSPSTSFLFPIAAPAAASTPATPSASGSVTTSVSGPTTPPGAGIVPVPNGMPADQDRPATSPPQRRSRQLLSRFWPQRSNKQQPDQSAGNGSLPQSSPTLNTASPPVATTSIRPDKSDAMVTQAKWESESISNPPRKDQRPSGSRPRGASAGPKRHTVARGETLAMIAQLYYGSARYDKALQSFNRGLTARPDRLTAGDLIVIPRIDELDPTQSSPGSSRAPLPVHVVRRYETLRSIARDRLGDSHRVDEIIELNRDRIPETNQLTQGQRLLLPSDATPARQAP